MIGWLIIGTHKYFELGLECIESIRKNYKGQHEQRYFFFTDRTDEVDDDGIETIHVEHETFPYISMRRYRHFTNHKELLSETDYLFYIDADMKFEDVGDEILEHRVATRHPGFWRTHPDHCTFDRNPQCNAYVPYGYMGPYFQNCFQGSETQEILQMSELLATRTDEDLSKGIIPLWHDESHMNKYMSENPPTKILDPGYAYCKHLEKEFALDTNFSIKVWSLDKDHAEIRSD